MTAVQTARVLSAKKETFYVPQLDGLRFIAFFLVFLSHSPQDIAGLVPIDFIQAILTRLCTFGWMGVDIFFCLSSFLITSLLLREQNMAGTISLRRFYIRRALRIWPLYFLVLALVFLVFPIIGFMGPVIGNADYYALVRNHLFPFMVFLGNFSYAFFAPTLTAALAPLWSISVEEQFYIVWPLLLSFLPRIKLRTFWCLLGGILALSIGIRAYIVVNGIPYPTVWVNTLTRMDPLVLGTGVALLYSRVPRIMPAWAALLLALALFGVATSFPQVGASLHTTWQLLAIGVGCAALLIGVLYGRFSATILGHPVLRWAGKLSYGFYMYHRIGQVLAAQFISVTLVPGASPAAMKLTQIGFSLAFTILVSTVSYYAFERWFLLLKDRFTLIQSGAMADEAATATSRVPSGNTYLSRLRRSWASSAGLPGAAFAFAMSACYGLALLTFRVPAAPEARSGVMLLLAVLPLITFGALRFISAPLRAQIPILALAVAYTCGALGVMPPVRSKVAFSANSAGANVPAVVVAERFPLHLGMQELAGRTSGFYGVEGDGMWSTKRGVLKFHLAEEIDSEGKYVVSITGTMLRDRPVEVLLNSTRLGTIKTEGPRLTSNFPVPGKAFLPRGDNSLVLLTEKAGAAGQDVRELGFSFVRADIAAAK